MKKTISLLLALVLCLSLCACGGSNAEAEVPAEDTSAPVEDTVAPAENAAVSKEDILANAVFIDAYAFYLEAEGNIVRTESIYGEKSVLFWDQVIEIQKEYIVVGQNNTRIKVSLSTEDIMEVTTGQYVFVAGTVSNFALDQEFSLPFVSMDMPQGFLVRDSEAEQAALYNNAKQCFSEKNYPGAIVILKHLNGYSDSGELLLEAVANARYYDMGNRDDWKSVFKDLSPAPLTEEEIKGIIVGNWYGVEGDTYSNYTENGEYHYFQAGKEANPNIPNTWKVEDGRLVRESEYTRSEAVIFPFCKNAYVFCYPRAYNQVSDDVYELHFLNGPVE